MPIRNAFTSSVSVPWKPKPRKKVKKKLRKQKYTRMRGQPDEFWLRRIRASHYYNFQNAYELLRMIRILEEREIRPSVYHAYCMMHPSFMCYCKGCVRRNQAQKQASAGQGR